MSTDGFFQDAQGQYLLKDPQAVLDYTFDWSVWLGTDTIASKTLTVTGATLNSSSNTTTAVTAWIAGGVAGYDVFVLCQIVTAGGRTDERTLRLKVQNR